jgi:hypothetical protein
MGAPRALVIACLVVLPAFSGCTIPGLGNGGLIQRNPGDAARDIISASTYSRLIVEIDYEAGGEANSNAVSLMETRLLANTGKIHVEVVREAGVAGKGAGAKYSFDEVNRLMQGVRSRSTGGDTAVIHVLYLNGGSTTDQGSSQVLGAAYCATCIVMFKGNIRENSRSDGSLPISGKPEEKVLEGAVLVHEVGHLLGLVNVGTPMQTAHEDPEHKGHSVNRDSVMYWAVDSTNVLAAFGLDDIPDDFDLEDKNDLRAQR